MVKPSSAKYIGRNRPPRVQIEFDVDSGNGTQKVEIPFVMGVMADLSGKSASELPDVGQRKFLEIDGDNFEKRLEAMKPRVTFRCRTRSARRAARWVSTSPSRAWMTFRPVRLPRRSSRCGACSRLGPT